MLNPTKLLLTTIITVLLLAGGVLAQRNPTMSVQDRDTQKETSYARFSELSRGLTAESQRLAYEAGKRYLKQFEGDKDADARAVRKFVDEYEKNAGGYDVWTAYKVKNYAKAFELGHKALELQPENFLVLAVLSEAGFDKAQAGDTSSNTETIGYLRRAIKVLDSGKVSNPAPFMSIGIAEGFLNVALGQFIKDQAPVEAAAALRKAVVAEGPYREDPVVFHRLGIAILKGEFQQLSNEYNQKYGSQKPSPEQQAMLQQVLKVGDRAIDAYARAAALSTKPEQQPLKAKLMEQLTALYKSLHNSSDVGMNELISSVLSKPLP
jgi:tetratricopeptide (TPR) repeat protein